MTKRTNNDFDFDECVNVISYRLGFHTPISVELVEEVVKQHENLLDEHLKNHGTTVPFYAIRELLQFFKNMLSEDSLTMIMSGYESYLAKLGHMS